MLKDVAKLLRVIEYRSCECEGFVSYESGCLTRRDIFFCDAIFNSVLSNSDEYKGLDERIYDLRHIILRTLVLSSERLTMLLRFKNCVREAHVWYFKQQFQSFSFDHSSDHYWNGIGIHRSSRTATVNTWNSPCYGCADRVLERICGRAVCWFSTWLFYYSYN